MRNITFSPPDISNKEIDAIVSTLKSGWITTGPKTKEFEHEIASYCRTNKAVVLNSATACLEMTLRILGVGHGDEVITSAYTYTASASVINHVGAKIVMVDSEKDSYNLDYNLVEKAITKNTKAIIPVDIAGVMCDYDRLYEVVKKSKPLFEANNNLQEAIGRIAIVADAAHSFGASRDDKVSGEMADFTVFSFHAVKNLTTSEGGAITWKKISGIDSNDLYKQYMVLSLHGQSKDAFEKNQLGAWEYDIISPSYKCNMTDLSAAMGLAQLSRYDELLDKRRRVVKQFDEGLKLIGLDTINHSGENFNSSNHLYLTRVANANEAKRNEIIKQMAEKGIATNVHYKPLSMHTAYKNLGFKIEEHPNAFEQYQNEITLPLHTKLTDQDVEYIVDCYKKIIKK